MDGKGTVDSGHGGSLAVDSSPASQQPAIAFAWKDNGRRLAVLRTLDETPTGFPSAAIVQATPACIIPAGHTRPSRMCTSGWRPNQGLGILEGRRWTDLVRRFAAVVGFHLHRSVRDTPRAAERVPANDGRFQACHAEKKLALYFLVQQMRHTRLGLDDVLAGRLRDRQLPLHRRRACIYLGHKPCKNCLRFLRLIRRRTGIDVRTAPCAVFSEHARKRTYYPAVLKPVDNQASTSFDRPATIVDVTDGSEDEGENNGGSTGAHGNEPDSSGPTAAAHDQRGGSMASGADAVLMDDAPPNVLEQADAVLESFAVGSVRRTATRDAPVASVKADAVVITDNKPKYDDKRADDAAAMPPPPPGRSRGRMSVHSTPSPSLPSLPSCASPAGSSILGGRRRRFPTYSSPPRDGASVAPPSVWGGRDKPPATPCLVPPEMWTTVRAGATGAAVADADNAATDAVDDDSVAAEQSYFFGTPSAPSTRSGDVGDDNNSAIPVDPPDRSRGRQLGAVRTRPLTLWQIQQAQARDSARRASHVRYALYARANAATAAAAAAQSAAAASTSAETSPCVRAETGRRGRHGPLRPGSQASQQTPPQPQTMPFPAPRVPRTPVQAPRFHGGNAAEGAAALGTVHIPPYLRRLQTVPNASANGTDSRGRSIAASRFTSRYEPERREAPAAFIDVTSSEGNGSNGNDDDAADGDVEALPVRQLQAAHGCRGPSDMGTGRGAPQQTRPTTRLQPTRGGRVRRRAAASARRRRSGAAGRGPVRPFPDLGAYRYDDGSV